MEGSALEDASLEALLPGVPSGSNLPRQTENPRLNRTAESIGSALGTTVGKFRSGMTLVQSRSEQTAREVTDTISQHAQSLTAAAVEQAERLGDVAEGKASEFLDSAQKQIDELREVARRGLVEARKQAAIAREEHPDRIDPGLCRPLFCARFRAQGLEIQ